MRLLSLFAIAAISISIGAVSAAASPITYTETFTASGTLGSTSFSDASVTMTLAGDTSNVFSIPCNCGTPDWPVYENTTGTTTFQISGLGSGSFTDVTGVYAETPTTTDGFAGFFGTDYLGFTQVIIISNGPLGVGDVALDGYQLTTAIGPVGPDGATDNPFSDFNTTAGLLDITTASNTVFTAVTVGVVPEPGSLALFAAGLFGIAFFRWKRG